MIRLGVSIFPNPTGKQNPVFQAGWSATDPGGFVWIEGPAADLLMDMPPVLSDLSFEVDCFPVEISAPSPQRVTVFANGLYLGTRFLRGRDMLTFPIPRETATGRQLRIALVPGLVEIPKLAGRGPDERPLSLAVFSVCLRNAA